MSYILSNANRLYTALESSYGSVAAVTAANRMPVVKLAITQQRETPVRRDKTGSRTFAGAPSGGRIHTSFQLQSYLTSWQQSGGGAPSYGPLFQSALGAAPAQFNGATVASAADGSNLAFNGPHGLSVGQAIASNNEIRFVAAIGSPTAVVLNAPLTAVPAAGKSMQPAVTYGPSSSLPSVSVFDYWSPATAVQRVLHGATVNELEIRVNGDYHEFQFSGLAQDLIDSSSFSAGVDSLQSFPAEPAAAAFDYSIVPGNLGQAWLGTAVSAFFTVTSASVALKNNLEPRAREFGSSLPLAIAPGPREVAATLELYSQDDSATQGLYQAARQQSPISVMFQLGNNSGQMMAVFLQSVIPVVPQFNDSQNRLQWQFRPSRAQGTIDNEIQVAFA
jgi:hypothetical protein